MVSAVTSLLKQPDWTTTVLGPCCSTAPYGALRHPRRQRKPLRKGMPVLEEATANKDLFFMPVQKSLCSWWSILCFQFVLLLLVSEKSTYTHSKSSNKTKNHNLQSFWRCLKRLFADAGRDTAVPVAVERKESSAKNHITVHKWIYHTQTKARQRRNHHFDNGKRKWKWKEGTCKKKGNGKENWKISQYSGELDPEPAKHTARTEQIFTVSYPGKLCVATILLSPRCQQKIGKSKWEQDEV